MISIIHPTKEKSDMIRKLLAGGLIALLATTAACATNAPTAPKTLQEDDPGWDCHTMGNRICGPILPPGTICSNSAMTENCTPPPDWNKIDESLADTISEGSLEGATTRRWEDCWINQGEVLCPDGTTHNL
jgi:hypothetical protein